MRAIYILTLASLVLLASCSNTKLSKIGYALNQDLLVSYKNYDESLSRERSEIVFNDGHTAKNCTTYLNLVSQYDLNESIYNQSIKSEYLICDALKILSEVSVASDKNAHDLDLGEKLSTKLDLRSFPSSLFRVSDEKKHSLKSLYPEDVTYKGSIAILETEDWVFRLEVAGVAPINDNDVPDWIVWVTDEAKLGNYRSYTTYIIYDPSDQENYIATSYP